MRDLSTNFISIEAEPEKYTLVEQLGKQSILN